jgi:polyisoprenoid-binding protein YceI
MLKNTLVAPSTWRGALIGAGQASIWRITPSISRASINAFVNFKISHLGYSWLYGTWRF